MLIAAIFNYAGRARIPAQKRGVVRGLGFSGGGHHYTDQSGDLEITKASFTMDLCYAP
jgi:hypothetical protein